MPGALPQHLQETVDQVREVEATMLALEQWLKYPVDAQGRVLDMNQLPDVVVTLVYHLTRGGWRWCPDKALIKPRRVMYRGYYEDLVTYVGVDDSDEPIVVERDTQPKQEPWSVTPQVCTTFEPRPQE